MLPLCPKCSICRCEELADEVDIEVGTLRRRVPKPLANAVWLAYRQHGPMSAPHIKACAAARNAVYPSAENFGL